MKKILSCMVFCAMMFLLATPVCASTAANVNLDELLAPYQEVLDKLNKELGTTLAIQNGAEETFYNAYKNYTLEEFENCIKQNYLDAVADLETDTNGTTSEVITASGARYAVVDFCQSAYLGNQTTLYLDSTLRGYGNPMTYRYDSINRIYWSYPSNYTGFHVELSNVTRTINSGGLSCTISASGSLVNAYGLYELVVRTYEVTFYANEQA